VVTIVARSSVGEYLGASVVVISGISDPEVLEAMAVREGLCLAEDLLIQHVHIASDRLPVSDQGTGGEEPGKI
jgi:hypothetical protein